MDRNSGRELLSSAEALDFMAVTCRSFDFRSCLKVHDFELESRSDVYSSPPGGRMWKSSF